MRTAASLLRELKRTRDETLQCFSLNARELACTYAYYAGVHYERSGHLEFVHSEFDKTASHNEHHLSQIRVALR